MSYAMSIVTEDERTLTIPVLPEKLAVSSPGKNKTQTVLGLGEVLLLRERGLRTVSWESFFPASTAPYVTGTVTEPIELVRAIQDARDSRKPVRFGLLGAELDINTQMGVDSFDYEERGGEPGDLYYSIQLSEWKEYGAKTLDLSAEGTATELPAQRGGSPAAPKSYTVLPGDSLWAIAKRFYGSGSKWKELYAANKSVVGTNPNLIYPGQVLTLV